MTFCRYSIVQWCIIHESIYGFVNDLNSTNGVLIDWIKISPNKNIKIKENSIISFSGGRGAKLGEKVKPFHDEFVYKLQKI